MSDPPLVSVIVPSFNQGRFLPATLDSILSQHHRPLEVVVVDGASTDDTVEVLRRYAAAHQEVRWVSEPDDGPADAVNKGLALARGAIAGIQSSDDVYLPGAVGAAVAAFEAEPALGLVYGDASVIDEHGTPTFTTSYLPFSLPRLLCGSTVILQSSTFFRTDLARALGGWRSQYFVMDTDLWLRMAFRAPVRKLPVVLSALRRHGEQRDTQTAAIWEGYRAMLRESDDVRRSSLRNRLAAAAGWRMITQHYNPRPAHRFRAAQMWAAIALYPPAIRAIAYPARLLPGRVTARLERPRPRAARRRPGA